MKLVILFITSVLFIGCKQDSNQLKNKAKLKNTTSDSIPYVDSDTIQYVNKEYFLKIRKLKDGYLELNYSLEKKSKTHSFKIKYFDFSDVIFAHNGVGIFDGNTIKYSKYHIVRDTILILPVIANNNSLSISLIDLKNEKVLFDDMRTSLNCFWVYDAGKIKCITSDSPLFTDPHYEYSLEEYDFTGSEFIKLKRESHTFNEIIKNNLDIEKQLVSKMFLSK